MTAQDTGRKSPSQFQARNISAIDFFQSAKPRTGIVLSGHDPLAIFGFA
jgi:hypothetical protein